jgi:hypothetical protein
LRKKLELEMTEKEDANAEKGDISISNLLTLAGVPYRLWDRAEAFAVVIVEQEMAEAVRANAVARSACVYRMRGTVDQCFWVSGYRYQDLLHRLVIPLTDDWAPFTIDAARRGKFLLEFRVRGKLGRQIEKFEISDTVAEQLHAAFTRSHDRMTKSQAIVTTMNDMLRPDVLKSIPADGNSRRVHATLVAPAVVRTGLEHLRMMRVLAEAWQW